MKRMVIAGLVLTLLLGCRPGQRATTASPRPTAPTVAAQTLLIWADDVWQEPLKSLAATYESTRGVKVAVQAMSSAEIHATLPTLAAQGKGPDLFIGPNEWIGELAAKGLLAAIDFSGKQVGFSRQSLDSFRMGARIYGAPICAENLALLRNRSLAPTAPTSIEGMAASGRRIVAKLSATPGSSPSPTSPAAATPAAPASSAAPDNPATASATLPSTGQPTTPTASSAPPTPAATTPAPTSNIQPVAVALPIGPAGDPEAWYPFFSAYGGYIYGQTDNGATDPLDLGVGLAGSVFAGVALQKLVALHAVSPKLDRAAAAAAFNTGKAPYLIGDPDNVITAKNAGIDVAIDPVPPAKYDDLSSSQSLVTYQGVMLSQFAHDRHSALDFLTDAVMTTAFMDAAFAAHPRQPAWLSAAQKVATDPIVAPFANFAADSVPTPNVAWMPVVWQRLGAAQVAITRGKSPKKALKAARNAILRSAANSS